jgi:hypothetical protein
MPTMSSTTAATRRRLKARIRRFDTKAARLRAMEEGPRMSRNFAAEDRLRGRLFDEGERLADDIFAYALAATAPSETIDRVGVRALALFVGAPAARGWFYR